MTFINYTNDGKAVIQSAALILSGLEREETLELHTLENAIVLLKPEMKPVEKAAAMMTLMRLVNTPSDIFADGQLYLGIYVGGFVFLFLYNVATGIFNSLGDSRTPLYFLIGSSLSNIVLDWAFVALFHWGVAGVAWATFLAQGVACLLSLFVLRRRVAQVECAGHHPLFSLAALGSIARIAVPSILQQSFISIGDMFIQGRVNSYGSSVIAGYSAAIKLNTFTITSFTTLANGVSGFTAQNVGAGKHGRVRQGWGAGIRLALCVAVPFFLAFFFGGRICLELFMNAEATQLARDTGMEFLRIVSPFYFVICFKLISDGVLRGAGCMRLFMAATFTDLALRVILAFAFSDLLNAAVGVWMAWPVGWCISIAMSLCFYLRGHWMPSWSRNAAEQEAEFLAHLPGCKAVRWNPCFADIIPADGGKPVGVGKMLERFGLKREESMAFGDGGNDIDMLRYAGVGVAMGNAGDDVKAAADYVTAGVDEDGVERALRHFGVI